MIDALRAHYEGMNSEWIVLREVWGIDALAWGMSRGQRAPYYRRVAYEVKVSREDFRNDLKAWPGKQRYAMQMSHQWLFAVPAGLLNDDEIRSKGPDDVYAQLALARPRCRSPLWVPERAGLAEVHPRGRVVIRRRPETRHTVEELTPSMIATLIRHVPRGTRRYDDYALQEAQADAKAARAQAKQDEARADRIRGRALEQLERHAGGVVEPGQRWRVPVNGAEFIAPYVRGDDKLPKGALVEVEVERVSTEGPWHRRGVHLRRDGAVSAPGRRLDWPDASLGQLLLYGERVED